MTPLHYAAKVGSLKIVKVLIDAGADSLTYNMDKKTPIQFAASNGHCVSFCKMVKIYL